LLESDIVDAVYVALSNSMRAEWTIKALRAGVGIGQDQNQDSESEQR
jgi:predicted dehydrogenase